MFTNKTKPLVFTHFSDVHTMQELWNRIVDFNNHYSNSVNDNLKNTGGRKSKEGQFFYAPLIL